MNYGSPSTAHAPAHGGYPGTVSEPAPHTSVEVARRPACDFCGWPAVYDAKTMRGPWANMCGDHFQANGLGLGLGLGQRLVVVQ